MTMAEALARVEQAQSCVTGIEDQIRECEQTLVQLGALEEVDQRSMLLERNAGKKLERLRLELVAAQREVTQAQSAVAEAEREAHAAEASAAEQRLLELDGELLGRLRALVDQAPALLGAIRETADAWRTAMSASGQSVNDHGVLVRWVQAAHAPTLRDRLAALTQVFLIADANERERQRTAALRDQRAAESRRRAAQPVEAEARERLVAQRGHELHAISVHEQERLIAEIAVQVRREREGWSATQ